jgi:hypothetical protein
VFQVDAKETVAVSGLTLDHGAVPSGYGGGAIDNLGMMTASGCTNTGSTAYPGV